MNEFTIEDKVFNAIREQSNYAEGLDYAMGEVFSTPKARRDALASMLESFAEECLALRDELNAYEGK